MGAPRQNDREHAGDWRQGESQEQRRHNLQFSWHGAARLKAKGEVVNDIVGMWLIPRMRSGWDQASLSMGGTNTKPRPSCNPALSHVLPGAISWPDDTAAIALNDLGTKCHLNDSIDTTLLVSRAASSLMQRPDPTGTP